MVRANVKPLTHWVIYKKYSVRFGSRTSTLVTGTLTTPEGLVTFSYEPQTMVIHLQSHAQNAQDEQEEQEETPSTKCIQINEYGWEVE